MVRSTVGHGTCCNLSENLACTICSLGAETALNLGTAAQNPMASNDQPQSRNGRRLRLSAGIGICAKHETTEALRKYFTLQTPSPLCQRRPAERHQPSTPPEVTGLDRQLLP